MFALNLSQFVQINPRHVSSSGAHLVGKRPRPVQRNAPPSGVRIGPRRFNEKQLGTRKKFRLVCLGAMIAKPPTVPFRWQSSVAAHPPSIKLPKTVPCGVWTLAKRFPVIIISGKSVHLSWVQTEEQRAHMLSGLMKRFGLEAMLSSTFRY